MPMGVFVSRNLPDPQPGDLLFRLDEENLPVRLEQMRTRMATYPSLIFGQMVLQPLFVWMFWNEAAHFNLLLWLSCAYAFHAVEIVNWVVLGKQLDTLKECSDWHWRFSIFSLAVGLVWGGAAMAFFPDDLGYQGLMICVMLGLVAGAATMNPVHPPSLYAYMLGIMVPLIIRVMLLDDSTHDILALMLIVFLIVVLSAGRGLNRTFMLSLRQRFENTELLQQVTERKAEAEAARKELELANNVLRGNESKLEQMVQERTSELLHRTREMELIKDTTIIALSSLAETRDNETGNHIRRTQNYIRALAVQLKDHPRFRDFLTEENINLLYKIAPLHDVGKVGIPDC